MNFLLTADLHLRDTPPPCRTDDFMSAQWRKLNWLMARPEVKVFAGDIFDRWTGASDLRRAMQFIRVVAGLFRNSKTPVLVVAGQHDLPNHRLDGLEESALGMLMQLFPGSDCPGIYLLRPDRSVTCGGVDFYGASWGEDCYKVERNARPKALVTHRMVWQGRKPPFPGAEGVSAKYLLGHKSMQDFNLIVTGDNHQSFAAEVGNRVLYNPGSVMRLKADQHDYHPCAFLWRPEGGGPVAVRIPHEDGVVSRDHIEAEQEEERRLSAFVARLGDVDLVMGSSFEDNLRKHMERHKVKEPVRQAIREAMA